VNETIQTDVDLLGSARARRSLAPGDEILDGEESPREVLLLLAGAATIYAETPFGPHPVATLKAPTLLNLGRALGSSNDLFRIQPEGKGEAATFGADEARGLLFDPSAAGQAFRRLALSSITAALRETNASIKKFFDSISANQIQSARDSGEIQAIGGQVPVNPEKVYDLLDAAGLNPSGLPDLGLLARHLPAEKTLVAAGTKGDEAYLLAEGKLRISIQIPGVGEEALAILGPGEIVGEMSLVDDAPRSADVRAHEGHALVYVLSRTVFRQLLESGDPAGAPLLAGITIALTRRHEDSVRKAATFRVMAGPF